MADSEVLRGGAEFLSFLMSDIVYSSPVITNNGFSVTKSGLLAQLDEFDC